MIEALTIGITTIALGGFFLQSRKLQKMKQTMAIKMKDFQIHSDSLTQEIREEQNRLLDALSDSFLLLDSAGVILFANTKARELFANKQLLGRQIQECFIDARLTEGVNRCIQTGEPLQTHVFLPQQSSPLGDRENRGINAWIVDAAKLGNSTSAKPHTRLLIRDVTAEYHLEQIRKDFVANASHELRTPLAIINGYIENLLEEEVLENGEMARRFLSIMQKHTDRISRIVEDMLMISRLESGENVAINLEPFQMKDCIQDVLERLESLILSTQVHVKISLHNEAMIFTGDRFYWTQILFNLIENALKQNTTTPHLQIEIGTSETNDNLLIWVSDNGMGIPSADVPHVFRRFYRVEKHHSQKEIKGTGLGLSIVKRAIEAHHGKICVSSTPGQETKFLMMLPKPNI